MRRGGFEGQRGGGVRFRKSASNAAAAPAGYSGCAVGRTRISLTSTFGGWETA